MKYYLLVLMLQSVLLYSQERSPYYVPRTSAPQEGFTGDLASPPSFAGEQTDEREKQRDIPRNRLNVNFGYSYSELHDLLMASSDLDSNVLQSQSDWELQNILVLTTTFDTHIEKIYLHLGFSLPLVITQTPMIKRDWFFDNPPGGLPPYNNFPSNAPSHHFTAQTRNEFSFSAEGSFMISVIEEIEGAPRFEIGAAFLFMTWGMIAQAGKGLYLLDQQGTLSTNVPLENQGDSILYRINYLVPAISMRFNTQWGFYGFEALLNYSPATFFIDHHKYYTSKVESNGFGALGQMLWGGITNRFWFSDHVALNLGLRGRVLFRSRIGSLVQENTQTGETVSAEHTAGSEYFDLEVFLGITMGF